LWGFLISPMRAPNYNDLPIMIIIAKYFVLHLCYYFSFSRSYVSSKDPAQTSFPHPGLYCRQVGINARV
jgi:hypothetical protein